MRLFKSKFKGNSHNPEQNLYSTDGPMGMKTLYNPSNADLDIVFVHGLTGNREKTWTHSNGTLWPRDLLPKDFPRARIMTYGYDVDVFRFSTTSSDRLYDCGQSLGYSIVSERTNCSTRPILFISHSVGGLVCQQTLVLSNTIDGLWQISSCSIGVIFMGTPHYGSSIALHREKLARCLGTSHSTQKEMDGKFPPVSNSSQSIGNDFQFMLYRGDLSLRIFCFYEAFEMNDEVGKIVEEHSAVLRGHESCSIDTNHANMTRFRGNTDGCYRLIRSIISRWLQDPDEMSANKASGFVEESTLCPTWLQPLDTEPFSAPLSAESYADFGTWPAISTPVTSERSWPVNTNHFNEVTKTESSIQRQQSNRDTDFRSF